MKTIVSQKEKKTIKKNITFQANCLPFVEKKQTKNINLSSAELAQRVLNGKNHFDKCS